MALRECKECGKDVSTEAKTCPHCGVSQPAQKGPSPTFIVIVVVLLLFGLNGLVDSSDSKEKVERPSPPSKEEMQAKAKEDDRFYATVYVAHTIKKNLRDPSSVEWEEMFASEDASIICISYRAKNGFGGMSREQMVVVNGKASQKATAWNRHCTQSLYNMKDVKYAVD